MGKLSQTVTNAMPIHTTQEAAEQDSVKLTFKMGFFIISSSYIPNNLEEVFEIFMRIGFYPTEILTQNYANAIKYVGYCENFDKIESGELLPEYELKFIEGANGELIDATINRKVVPTARMGSL